MLQRSGGSCRRFTPHPRWLWGLLRQARLPQFGQHSEFTSVLAACAQGQENAGVAYRAGESDTPLPGPVISQLSAHRMR